MPIDEIVVLANSKKLGGRCVAGISRKTKQWVRPISSRPNGALPFQDGVIDLEYPAVLDVVSFAYRAAAHDPAQPENVLLEDGKWERIGAIEQGEAYDFLEPHLVPGPDLLGNREKGIAVAAAQEGLASSLCLAEPESISFVCQPPFKIGKPRGARAVFSLGSQCYDFGITDAVVAPRLRSQPYGTYAAEDLGFDPTAHTLLTVSLTTPLNATHWKLVAGVMFLP